MRRGCSPQLVVIPEFGVAVPRWTWDETELRPTRGEGRSVSGPIGAFFRWLRKRLRRTVAITATAQKLVTIAYLMLKQNDPYRYAKPVTVQSKLNAVRRKAREAGPNRTKAAPEPDRGIESFEGEL